MAATIGENCLPMTSRKSMHIPVAVVLTITIPVKILAADPSPEALRNGRQIRQAIERSLPFLEKEGTAWMKQRNCIACHHVPYLLWAHNEAAARGFVVDRKKIREWSDWSLAFYPAGSPWFRLRDKELGILKRSVPAAVIAKLQPLADRSFASREELAAEVGKALSAEEMRRYQAEILLRGSQFRSDGGPFHIAQLLLGRRRSSVVGAEAEGFAGLATFLVGHQEADGSWKTVLTQFTNQRRPEKEMQEAMTMWTVLALNSLKHANAAKANVRALSWLKEVRPSQTTESLVLLLVTHQKDGQVKTLLDELLKRQNNDGGWSWLPGQGSDALTTGQVLYALGQTKPAREQPALRRAWQFLLKTQRNDGSWLVPASRFSVKTNAEYLRSADLVYAYWGTGWATIGLLHTLP